jgi:serine acetyltransferase
MDAMMLYKVSNWLYRKKLGWLAKRVQKINNSQHNSYIPCTAQLGKDTVFAYGGIGMVIHSNAIVDKLDGYRKPLLTPDRQQVENSHSSMIQHF